MSNGRKLIVGYVCEYDPFIDRTSWSGLIYKIRESIEQAGFEVVWIGCRPHGKVSKFFKLLNVYLHGKSTMYEHTKSYFRLRAWAINKALVAKCDFLFFPSGAQTMNYLKCNKPYIYFSDTTFQLMCGYYWKKLTRWQYRTGNSLESVAIANAWINIRASQWAADSVVFHYHFDANRVGVLGFGANIDDLDISSNNPYTGEGRLNVLFSGVDWKRKGAEIAIRTIEILNERGYDAHLYIIGIKELPENYRNHPYIEFVGYVNKSIPQQYAVYLDTIKKCHMLLLPTRAECAGIVFCEASAYGIPTFTYDTGGIPDYVLNGENGFRLPLTCGAEDFADKIQETLSPQRQLQLHKHCLQLYEKKLRWAVWSHGFRSIIKEHWKWS